MLLARVEKREEKWSKGAKTGAYIQSMDLDLPENVKRMSRGGVSPTQIKKWFDDGKLLCGDVGASMAF